MTNEIHDGFIRQRKNLIAVSLLLIFAETSGIEINKINLLGNEVSLKNPNIVYIILWMALFYWFARYYQYFRNLKDKGFKTTFFESMDALVSKIAFKNLFNDPNFIKTIEQEGKKHRAFSRKYHIYKRSLKHYEGAAEFLIGHVPDSGISKREKVIVEFPQLIIPLIRSFSHVLIHTRLFTEYISPFLFFLTPIIYKVCKLYNN